TPDIPRFVMPESRTERSAPPVSQPPVKHISPPVNSPRQAHTESAADDVLHTVTFRGETLYLIATWYTGTSKNAGRIAEINSITNPNAIRIGDVIRIPRYLLIRNDPLPRSRVAANRADH
ncbi:MAG: LysM peptidoglycan-binding domain-containing protein, partial [Bdellovibrionales bacterium]|nr:LysM peptidoglycan-binding domain-containing protein [Bdellovibrionales bacterium]